MDNNDTIPGQTNQTGAHLNDVESQTLSRRWFLGAAISAAAAGPMIADAANTRVATHAQPELGPTPEEAIANRAVTDEQARTAATVAGLDFRPGDIPMLADSLTNSRRQLISRRRSGPPTSAPAQVFRVMGDPGLGNAPDARLGVVNPPAPATPTGDPDDIAFAPATQQAQWLRDRVITSRQLTQIYLSRIEKHAGKLNCIITTMRESALEQAARADDEIRAGNVRGPLHGLPYGLKDLFDTAGVRTTYGAEPYKDRVPEQTAVIVDRLEQAGAVLIAKTSLGALAYGDIWFGGTCRNPFDTEQGSSGSSAGSASGTAAGLFSFSIGTETLGSIVSPSMRCGTAGLRPTFGRVPRTNSMELCWSLDKVGPICRSIGDTAMVLAAINGADPGDPSSLDAPFDCDLTRDLEGLRVGYMPRTFGERTAELDNDVADAARRAGAEMVELDYDAPDWLGMLRLQLNVEAAAAFERLTLSGRDAELSWQSPRAWPNTFRSSWLVPAPELVQADRARRAAMLLFDDLMNANNLDAIVGPSFGAQMLLLTNFTGTPCAVFRTAMLSRTRPYGHTVWARAFGDGTAIRVAHAIEQRLDAWRARPLL